MVMRGLILTFRVVTNFLDAPLVSPRVQDVDKQAYKWAESFGGPLDGVLHLAFPRLEAQEYSPWPKL